MAFYQTTRELYRSLELLFHRIQEEDPKAGEAVVAAKLIIRLQVVEPTGVIVINGRVSPVHTSFGPNPLPPDLDIQLSGDTLHQILRGDLSLTKAVANKQLKVQGPIFKTFVLAPLFAHSQKIYPTILREQGSDAASPTALTPKY